MFFKNFKNKLILFFFSLFIIPLQVSAYSDYVIAGGENIGIQIQSNGVIVVGLYQVGNKNPGSDAGLKVGDRIISINNHKVGGIDEMVKEINRTTGKEIQITYIRDRHTYQTKLKLSDDMGGYKTGLYVKDKISGVGTLTYIDPNTKIFGALGHEIIEKNSGKLFDANQGKIFKSVVTDIEKSRDGTPGEKNAIFYSSTIYGTIEENTMHGIYGDYTSIIPSKTLIKVAKSNEIRVGKATVLTVVENEKVEEFEIEIIKLNNDSKTKNILFKITDQRLLNITGGIVQGMSGSPIIQNNKIIGAVTHVVVDDSEKGYGIFITNMLEEGEN